MDSYRPRSELVISMTIAEMFLLLVFMVWYVSSRESQLGGAISVVEAENARLKAENEKLKDHNRRLLADLNEAQKSLEFWRTRFGQYPPQNVAELQVFLQELGRGKPKCQGQNLVAQASVLEGEFILEFLVDSPELQRVAGEDRNLFNVRNVIKGVEQIDRVLRYVREVEASGGPGGKGCRFDYRLSYSSYKDYHDGRELFESSLFYAAARPRRIAGVVGHSEQ